MMMGISAIKLKITLMKIKKWFEDNMLPVLNKRGRWNLSIGK